MNHPNYYGQWDDRSSRGATIRLKAEADSETREAFNILSERAGTHQRERCLTHLSESYASGYLDDSELKARSEGVRAAKTVHQLQALTEDLPPMQPITSRTPIRRARDLIRWNRLNGIQKLCALILAGTVAVAQAFIVPIMFNAGHTPISPFIDAPVTAGSIFGGIAALICLIIVGATDKDIRAL